MPRDIFHLGYSVKMSADTADTAELMLYGEIVEDGPKWWKWSDNDKSASDFDKDIKDIIKAGAKKLLLRINSPGGVCTESVAMRSILASAGFDEITIRIEGLCASAATDIATLPGARVYIAEGSEYMIHNPWCWAAGNANELEKTIERLRNIEQVSRSFYVKRTGQSEEQIKQWMDEEKWFTAEQAVEYGFADEVLYAEAKTETTPIAACVSDRAMAAMHGLYKAVPEQIAVKQNTAQTDSNAAPICGAASAINQEEDPESMNISEINAEQLRTENPALFEQIRQDAIAADRQRREDIDALTLPGYESMAEDAKRNGMTAMDFQRQVVQAQKQNGAAYLSARQTETAPAQSVKGAEAPADGDAAEQEIKQYANDIAAYAKSYRGGADGSMY